MKTNPCVSVIMPIYNGEKYIKNTIESILTQTLKEFELILIDDGSTDSSYDLIKEYESADERIVVVHQDNKGQAIARNNGIGLAKGKYLVFWDCDDFF